MEYRIPIPQFYRKFTKGSDDPVGLYYRYATAYLNKNYPEYEIIDFDKEQVICILKSDKN